MQRDLPLSKKIFFSLVIVILIFLALELTIRLYHSIKFKEKSYLFYGGHFVKKLIEECSTHRIAKIYTPNLVSREADTIFLNRREFILDEDFSKYFRNWNFTVEKKSDTIRIVAMGGSFVWGVALNDTETWEYLLGEELNKHSTDKRYEVMNCSEGNLNIEGILIRLIKYVVPLKPDYLIIFSAINNHALVKQDRRVSFAWKLSHFLYNTSRFYSTVRDKLAFMLSRDIYLFHDNFGVCVTEDAIEAAVNLYGNRLKQISIVCRENNITPILCLQPIFLPENLKNLENLLDGKQLIELGEKINRKGRLSHYEFRYYMQGRFNFEMKRFAETQGILLFDGVGIFPKDRHLDFIDVIHLSRKGTVTLAKELFLFFVKKGIDR